MSTTSEERREVAERLRESAQAGEYLDYSIANAILSIMRADEVYLLPIGSILADLIDPTCTSVLAKDGLAVWRKCSMCGEPLDSHVNYCPNCGSRLD